MQVTPHLTFSGTYTFQLLNENQSEARENYHELKGDDALWTYQADTIDSFVDDKSNEAIVLLDDVGSLVVTTNNGEDDKARDMGIVSAVMNQLKLPMNWIQSEVKQILLGQKTNIYSADTPNTVSSEEVTETLNPNIKIGGVPLIIQAVLDNNLEQLKELVKNPNLDVNAVDEKDGTA